MKSLSSLIPFAFFIAACSCSQKNGSSDDSKVELKITTFEKSENLEIIRVCLENIKVFFSYKEAINFRNWERLSARNYAKDSQKACTTQRISKPKSTFLYRSWNSLLQWVGSLQSVGHAEFSDSLGWVGQPVPQAKPCQLYRKACFGPQNTDWCSDH